MTQMFHTANIPFFSKVSRYNCPMGILRSVFTIRVILDEAKEVPIRRRSPNIAMPRTLPKIARGAAIAAKDIYAQLHHLGNEVNEL